MWVNLFRTRLEILFKSEWVLLVRIELPLKMSSRLSADNVLCTLFPVRCVMTVSVLLLQLKFLRLYMHVR